MARRDLSTLLYEMECDLRAGLPNGFDSEHSIWKAFSRLRDTEEFLTSAGVTLPPTFRKGDCDRSVIRVLTWMTAQYALVFPTLDFALQERVKVLHGAAGQVARFLKPVLGRDQNTARTEAQAYTQKEEEAVWN